MYLIFSVPLISVQQNLSLKNFLQYFLQSWTIGRKFSEFLSENFKLFVFNFTRCFHWVENSQLTGFYLFSRLLIAFITRKNVTSS